MISQVAIGWLFRSMSIKVLLSNLNLKDLEIIGIME